MKQKRKGQGSTIRTILVMSIVALVVLVMYFNLSNKELSDSNQSENLTEVQNLLKRDLENDYPATAREVVKLYLRITESFYNEELTQGELKGLTAQASLLFDEELAEKNPQDKYVTNLIKEINDYKEKNRKFENFEIENGSAVRYYKKDNAEYASLMVKITTRDAQIRYYTNEKFILRKDEKGNYKILGWQVVDDVSLEQH